MSDEQIPEGAIPIDQFQEASQGSAGVQQQSIDNSSPPPGAIPIDQFQSREDIYGTPIQKLITGVEGFAKGVAGPAATAAEVYSGITTPEAIRGRAEENPWIHGVPEAAGFFGSMMAGTGLASEVGEIGNIAEEAAGLGGKGASTISKIASNGIRTGAEMMALQTGDEISKAITQDPGQSLGTAAINVGLSGILGGAGGSVIGAVSPLFQAGIEKMGIPKLIDDAKATFGFRQANPNVGEAVSNELGTRIEEMRNIRTQMGELKGNQIASAMPEITAENSAKIDGQVQSIATTMEDNIKKASEDEYLKASVPKLKQDYKNFMDVVTDPESSYVDKFDAINDLKTSQQAKSNYNLTAEDTALGNFTKGIARDLRLSLEDNKVWGDAANIQRDTNAAIKKSIDAEKLARSKFTKKDMNGISVSEDKVQSLINRGEKGKALDATGAVKDYLEHTTNLADTLNKIHTDYGLEAPISLTPTPATDFVLGRSSPGHTLGNWLFDKGAAGLIGHSAGTGIGTGIGSLIGHPALGAIAGEKMLSPVLTSIAKPLMEKATNSVAARAAVDYVASVVRGEKILNQATENFFSGSSRVLAENLIPGEKDREKLQKSLDHNSMPQNLLSVGGNLNHYLGDHQTALSAAAVNGVNYFHSIKPKQAPGLPLDKTAPIDKAQQASYNRALDVAQQPLLVLEYAKRGTLLPQDIQTVKAIYPALYSKISDNISQKIIQSVHDQKYIPYNQKVMLSMLTGNPLDGTTTQTAMMRIMASNSGPSGMTQPQGMKAPKASKTSLAAINKTNSMYQTPMQSRQMGRMKE